MRRNMSRNLGLYKYLWPGSVSGCVWDYRANANFVAEEYDSMYQVNVLVVATRG